MLSKPILALLPRLVKGCPDLGLLLQSPMPSGRVHLTVELALLPGWVAAGAWLGVGERELTAFTLSYTCASLLLSPDLDLARSAPARRWGALRILWTPYALLFRHRGLSHSLLLGPLTRLLYLGGLAALTLLALHYLAGVPLPHQVPGWLPGPVLAGVYLSHFLHVGLDRLADLKRRLPIMKA